MLLSQAQLKTRTDTQRNRNHAAKFNIGDLVMVHRTFLETQRSRKMEDRWEGPYRLTEKLGETDGVSWKIEGLYGDPVQGKYHVRRLKPFLLDAGVEEFALQGIRNTLEQEDEKEEEQNIMAMEWQETIEWEDMSEDKNWMRYSDTDSDTAWW
jgi:hypothetical protein